MQCCTEFHPLSIITDFKSWGLLQICSSWLVYILPVPSVECLLYGIYKFPCKNQKKGKTIKYVAAINVKVAILRITWVALSLNIAETVFSVILPFLMFGGPLWVWENYALSSGKSVVTQGLWKALQKCECRLRNVVVPKYGIYFVEGEVIKSWFSKWFCLFRIYVPIPVWIRKGGEQHKE